MAKFKYGLFYDFHTITTIPDVGAKFDIEEFTNQVKACGVDFLTWHARCNQGSAYYDTKYGKRHPSLPYDMIRRMGDSCRKKGILFSVYFNGHLSDEELIDHRDWNVIEPEGHTYHGKDFNGPWVRMACYNSPFREHLKNMVVELAENYPVDGFFFDCLGAYPCICEHCLAEMKEKGIDWKDKDAVNQFSAFSVHRMCEYLNDAIRKVKPDSLLFFNGRPFEEVIPMESHLECECLPTGGWGYECLPILAHYMRTVAGPDKSVLNMTGRFNDWGDFGGLRTAEGLEYDLFYGAANGMRPDIGGHFHPRGDMDQPVFDRIREVYANLQKYDRWVIDAVNTPEIALVYPRKGQYYPNSTGMTSAVRMLTELKIQFDLVSDFVSWDPYKLLIFPEDVPFTEEFAKRVEAHLKRGGKVFATSRSGLDPEGKKFVLDSWPAVYEGPVKHKPLYFMPSGKFAEGLPAMPLSVYASGSQVRPAADADVEMTLVKPYVNFGWDGLRSNYYIPPQETTEEPFLLKKGGILYISAELFTGYFNRAPVQLRQILDNALKDLMPEMKLRTENLPSFSRAFVQKKENMELVHILAYCPEKRCNAIALEDRITLVNSRIALRTDGKKIRSVTLAPDGTALPFEIKDGYCHVTVPMMTGYALVVFES